MNFGRLILIFCALFFMECGLHLNKRELQSYTIYANNKVVKGALWLVSNGSSFYILNTKNEKLETGFGPYWFTRQSDSIFLNGRPPQSKEVITTLQYVLDSNVKIYSVDILSTYGNTWTYQYKSKFLKDTTIVYQNVKYNCFIFLENQYAHINALPLYKKIYLDKKTLIPIRMEFYEN